MKRYKLIGINVDSISPDEVYQYILRLSELGKPCHVVLLDTYLIAKARLNKKLRAVINSADLVIPVTIGIKYGLKFFNIKVAKVYNYFQFLINLLLHFTDEKKFIYVLGGKKKLIEKVDRNIKDSYPGIRLVGRYHGQYKKDFEKDLLTAIKKASPALFLYGGKSPKQEKWIFSRKNNFKNCVIIGVGNFINIVGGKSKAPNDMILFSKFLCFMRVFKTPFRFMNFIFFLFALLYYKLFKRKK